MCVIENPVDYIEFLKRKSFKTASGDYVGFPKSVFSFCFFLTTFLKRKKKQNKTKMLFFKISFILIWLTIRNSWPYRRLYLSFIFFFSHIASVRGRPRRSGSLHHFQLEPHLTPGGLEETTEKKRSLLEQVDEHAVSLRSSDQAPSCTHAHTISWLVTFTASGRKKKNQIIRLTE